MDTKNLRLRDRDDIITEEGIIFRSHIDGREYTFTPESVIDMQRIFGVDIAMILDECIPYPAEKKYAEKSTLMTLRWAERTKDYLKNKRIFFIRGISPIDKKQDLHSRLE